MPRRRSVSSVPDFTLGADPEFVVYQGGNLVMAQATGFATEDQELGGDGSGRPFELRPEPTECPLELVSNMRGILSSHCTRNPGFYSYDWRAGSFHMAGAVPTPIGGHIHVGGVNDHIEDFDALIYALDDYVGLASVLMEERAEGLRRRQRGYGEAADFREQDYGFEYRTPSSWLVSPHAAAGLLCLTKTLIHEILRGGFRSAASIDEDDVLNMHTDSLRPNWERVWTHIKTMDLYPRYRPHLDYLNWVISNKLTWYPRRSMKEVWGILPPVPKGGQPLITLDSLWHPIGEVRMVKATPRRKAPSRKPLSKRAVVDKVPQGGQSGGVGGAVMTTGFPINVSGSFGIHPSVPAVPLPFPPPTEEEIESFMEELDPV